MSHDIYIDNAADDHGYSRVRLHPRGRSSPLLSNSSLPTATNDGRADLPLDAVSATSSICGSQMDYALLSGSQMDYALPSNSHKLQSLNLTPGGSGNSSSSSSLASPNLDYAKLGFTKEGCMLRSGVSLRRNQRESLCSIARQEEEGEGQGGRSNGGGGRGGSSGEEEKKEEEDETSQPTNK